MPVTNLATVTFDGATDGTVLSSMSAENGVTFVRHPASTTGRVLTITGGRVWASSSNTSGEAIYTANGITPPSADYAVSVELSRMGGITGTRQSVLARYDASADTGYEFTYQGSNQFQLCKRVNGTITNIFVTNWLQAGGAGVITFAIQNGGTYKLTLRCVGNIIEGCVDDVPVIQYIDTSSPITTTGLAGLLWSAPNAFPTYGSGNGLEFDNFSVETAVVPTVVRSLGSGKNYSTFSAWESGEQRDLPKMASVQASSNTGFALNDVLVFKASGTEVARGTLRVKEDFAKARTTTTVRVEVTSGSLSGTNPTTVEKSDGTGSVSVTSVDYAGGEISLAVMQAQGMSGSNTVAGWGTSADCYMRVTTDFNADKPMGRGNFNSASYSAATLIGNSPLTINGIKYARFEDVIVSKTGGGAGGYAMLIDSYASGDQNDSDIRFENAVFENFSPNQGYGAQVSTFAKVTFLNCLAAGFNTQTGSTSASTGFMVSHASADVAFYNCTARECTTGFAGSVTNAKALLKNNLAVACTKGYDDSVLRAATGSTNNHSDVGTDTLRFSDGSSTPNLTTGTVTLLDSRIVRDAHLALNSPLADDGVALDNEARLAGYRYKLCDATGVPRRLPALTLLGKTVAARTSWSLGADQPGLELTCTIKSSGGDFSSLVTFTSQPADLIKSNTVVTGVVYIASNVISSGALGFSTFKTGPGNYLLVKSDDTVRHAGKWQSGAATVQITSGGDGTYLVSLNIRAVRFEGLQFEHAFTGSTRHLIGTSNYSVPSRDHRFERCIFRLTGGTGAHNCFHLTVGGGVFIWNCAIYNFNVSTGGAFASISNSAAPVGYNITVHNCTNGFWNSGNAGNAATYWKNCRATSCTTPWQNPTNNFVANNNFTDHATASAPGTGSISPTQSGSVTVNYVDAANGDFHLAAGDSGIGAGANLTNDPVFPIAMDIDGHARPSDGAWDIGADTYNSGGGGTTTVTKTVTVQSVLRQTLFKTVSAAGVVQATLAKQVTVGASLRDTKSKSVTAASVLQQTRSKSTTGGATLRGTYSKTVSVSARIQGAAEKAVSVMATLKGSGTRTTSVRAGLQVARTQQLTVGAVLRTSGGKAVNVTATLSGQSVRNVSVTADLSTARTRTVTAGGVLQQRGSKQVSALALLSGVPKRTVTVGATLKSTRTLSASALGTLSTTGTGEVAVLATLVQQRTLGVSVRSSLLFRQTRSINVLANLAGTMSRQVSVRASLYEPTDNVLTMTFGNATPVLALTFELLE